jgi:phosphatidylglycerol:prolipoprotein diacylglycerol transferase
MIPYFEQPRLSLGPLTIHAFGVLVAIAVLVGHRVFRARALQTGIDPRGGERLLTYVLVGGFIGAHLVDRLVYFPGETLSDPWSILRVWDGLSSFGGFLGAVLGAIICIRREPPGFPTWKYLDAVAYCFVFGWIFGRLGCFVAFDHPGSESRFFLAMVDKHGVPRHNLGLDEAIFTMALALVFYLLARRPRYPGFFLGLLPLLYAPFRFAADFLRVRDVRYGGLTPGQWGTMALLLLGVAILVMARRRAGTAPAEPLPTGQTV